VRRAPAVLAAVLLVGVGLGACAQGGPCARAAPRPASAAVSAPDPRSAPIAGADLSLPIPPPMDDPGARSPAGAPPAAVPYADADTADLPPAGADVAAARAWKVIVVHHSATARGGAALFDVMHREKGWDGVGYDFVIGNGTDTKDGEIETTPRWTEQKDGAHVKGWNDVAIGICLVGNFETADPTAKQMEALVRLVRHLRRRFHVPPERVVGHGSLGATLCPGKRLSVADVVAKSDPAPKPAASAVAGPRAP
jgi:hypothetical protein